MLDEHGCTTRYTRSDWDTEAHCRSRIEIIRTKELAESETASHAADVVPINPSVRSSGTMDDQDGNDDRGGLGWRTVACDFGHWRDHWEGLI